MKLDREEILALPPEKAATWLMEAGKELRGKNLKRESWLKIANGLHIQRISAILLLRLEAAVTRADALRVLRIAGKWNRLRSGAKGAHHKPPKENLIEVAQDTSPAAYQEYLDNFQFLEDFGFHLWGNQDEEFTDWLAEESSGPPREHYRVQGLKPVSPLHEAIFRCAWENRPNRKPLPEDIRSRVNETTYQKLRTITPREMKLDLTAEEATFLQAHSLLELWQFARDLELPQTPSPIKNGIEMAGLRIIESALDGVPHPFSIDWAGLEEWLAERLLPGSDGSTDRRAVPVQMHSTVPDQSPLEATAEPVIISLFAVFRSAPLEIVQRLLAKIETIAPAWLPSLLYLLPRIDDLLPSLIAKKRSGEWTWYPNAYANPFRYEWALDACAGSALVLYLLKSCWMDLYNRQVRTEAEYWDGARVLLSAGGGTLRRMDYPPFTLYCRPSIYLVQLETFERMLKQVYAINSIHQSLQWFDSESLWRIVSTNFSEISESEIPYKQLATILFTLERHAIAYVMLKEHVFKEAFQTAPFRLRRKHIQRFWATMESGLDGTADASSETGAKSLPGDLVIPKDLPSLAEGYPVDLIKEALAHALLDHFKDDWDIGSEEAKLLKEAFVLTLRNLALTYHYEDCWVPESDATVDDLVHSAELAEFLIRRTEHAPIELAQALMIDPHHGLPMLNGGHLSPTERSCRKVIREAAGYSQKQVTEGITRIFTCKPISKSKALDRGDLGGDCSSGSVPMRALSPHHSYYGIFEGEVQQRGYITVYEAWGQKANGERQPVLCLETINIPARIFDSVQQDLLLILEAVAKSRGLLDGLVLITDIGSWNYQNGKVLQQCRRFRQGTPVEIFPADPVTWNIYRLLTNEADQYSAFTIEEEQPRTTSASPFRILAPFDPQLDFAEPENRAEAERIAALPPRRLMVSARSAQGIEGFISELPKIL